MTRGACPSSQTRAPAVVTVPRHRPEGAVEAKRCTASRPDCQYKSLYRPDLYCTVSLLLGLFLVVILILCSFQSAGDSFVIIIIFRFLLIL